MAPRPPIQPEELPKIRELLSAEEYEKSLKRLEVVSTVELEHERAPNAAGALGADLCERLGTSYLTRLTAEPLRLGS